jgi:hypothetical protein
MADFRAYVFKTDGEVLGYFLDPELEQLSDKQFLIKGKLYSQDDQLMERAQFNPQTLPYQVDIASATNGSVSRLFHAYVLRAHQPVEIVGASSKEVLAQT